MRRRETGRAAGLAIAIAVMPTSAIAATNDAGERVLLEYHALDECPDKATFEARARSRSPRLHFVDAGESRTFEVEIEAGSPLTGRLVVRRGEQLEGSREVHGATCSELVDALALMVDLAVDPSAVLQGAPAPPTALAPPDRPSAPTLPPEPAAPAPSIEELPMEQAETPRAVVNAPPRAFYLGADVAFATGISPRTLVGPAPYVGWRSGREGIIDPGVRLGFLYGASGSVDAASGAASFTWTVGRVDACLLSWPPGRARLLACARAEAGALGGTGAVVTAPQSRTRPWLAAGPLLRAEWAPVGTLFFDADVAAMLHVTDDRFYFSPNATVYAVPVAGIEAAAGLGVHFL